MFGNIRRVPNWWCHKGSVRLVSITATTFLGGCRKAMTEFDRHWAVSGSAVCRVRAPRQVPRCCLADVFATPSGC